MRETILIIPIKNTERDNLININVQPVIAETYVIITAAFIILALTVIFQPADNNILYCKAVSLV